MMFSFKKVLSEALLLSMLVYVLHYPKKKRLYRKKPIVIDVGVVVLEKNKVVEIVSILNNSVLRTQIERRDGRTYMRLKKRKNILL